MEAITDLKDWELIISNGVWWVGRVEVNGHSMAKPIYHMHYAPAPVNGPNGEPGIGHMVSLTPFLGCGLPSLKIPEGAIRIALQTLGSKDGWLGRINQVRQQELTARAQAAGIVLASNVPH